MSLSSQSHSDSCCGSEGGSGGSLEDARRLVKLELSERDRVEDEVNLREALPVSEPVSVRTVSPLHRPATPFEV